MQVYKWRYLQLGGISGTSKMAAITCSFLVLAMVKEICTVQPYDWNLPVIEKIHDRGQFVDPPARTVNGTSMPGAHQTPDWRLVEPPWYAFKASYMYRERERPYRMSPHYKQMIRWKKTHKFLIESQNIEYPDNLGCYCTTVYKRVTVLAGCAVLTPRHILTTATSTELVIRDRRNDKTLENVLGLWYDHSLDRDNSSMYATPARIHYHPRYIRATQTNATHPLPVTFDLSVWATTYPLYYYAKYCVRANSGWFEYGSTVPRWSDMTIIVGFQFVKSLRKYPMPWFKYAVRTQKWVRPCPKNDWGWFHCVGSINWASFGVESGAAWHRAVRKGNWMYDGLAAMAAFSMKLRSTDVISYFTVINVHPVLDFLYDAYMGRLPYEYLDQRFYNTQWRAPKPKTYIHWNYAFGYDHYYYKTLPYYK